MIKAIGFDFDGTLVQSNAIKQDAYYAVTKPLGDIAYIVREVLAENAGDRTAILGKVAGRAMELGLLPAPADGRPWAATLVERYSRFCEDAIAACPEVPGAMRAIGSLSRKGYGLFLNSATPLPALEAVVARREMGRFFGGVYGGFSGKVENLKAGMARFASSPAETVFVGDNEVDRAAAETVGCHFIGILNDFSGYLTPPGHLVADMTGVESILSAIESRV
jgi:phosphoglycolate phosphatase-like HAD superfamily hydrolase